MAELVFFRRGEEVLRVALSAERLVVGRGERCDVVVPDPEVSRQQLALWWDGAQCHVEDLSGNGTRVGGQRVSSGVLPKGGDLELGQWRAVFRVRAADEALANEPTMAGGTRTEVQLAADAPRWQAAQVRVRRGNQETVHRLQGEVVTVGKEAGNDLVIEDRFISARHLRISRVDGYFRVADMGSTNGTFLGPVRVHDVEVPMPSALRVGETELVLEPVPSRKEVGDFHGIIGNDPSVRQLAELIERVAPSAAAVTVLGESGTGKELVARALHACSTRAAAPLIPVNCAAISKELIESELFGHEKGAFTGALVTRKGAFEEADGGTIFLDEIGELPLDLQAKLLRALESGEIKRVGASRPMHVDTRVVAATNRDLLALSREGKFREDLYYRLCVIPLHLPPLRSRRTDVLALAEHFLRVFSPKGQQVRLTPAAVVRLQAHAWPGNVRELRNVVHRALLLRRGASIDAEDITFDQEVNRETGVAVPDLVPGLTLEQMLERVERQIVETALRKFNNNRERVARELGVARSTLFKRLKDWGLTKSEEEVSS